MGTFSEQPRRRMTAIAQAIGAYWRPAKLLLALSVALLLIPLVQPFVIAATAPTPPPHPTTYDPTKNNTSITHYPKPPATLGWKAPATPSPLVHPNIGPMADATIPLVPGQATDFLSSDGRLEVQLPATAVTAADVQTASGKLQLQITQLAPPFGSNAGGSGLVSFGTYQLQLVDATGTLAATSLRAAPTLRYHYQDRDQTVDLDHAFVLVNGSRPAHSKSAKAPPGVDPAKTFGAQATHPATHDKPHHVLSVTLSEAAPAVAIGGSTLLGGATGKPALPLTPLNVPSTTVTWGAFNTVATYGKPEGTSVALNSGSLSFGLPINVPAGPGGTLPSLGLAYNSATVSEQHNPQAPAGWVGEGWNLTLGQISWVQRDENATGSQTKGQSSTWDDQWQIDDPFGTSAELIPPNIGVSTYYDYSNSGNSYTTPPVIWHTAPETHAKVVEIAGPAQDNIGDPTNPPCWRVWLPNGMLEEFGCTKDALQYYPSTVQGRKFMVSWLLDLIADPQGNQVHITYQNDTETGPNSQTYPRDVVLSTIEYDDPTCTNANTECTPSGTGWGTQTGWNPTKRITFSVAHTPAHLTNTPANCNTASNVRCDDPQDLSGSGGVSAPLVMPTFVLNEIDVQANTSGTWNTVRKYQLSYEQNGPATHQDPATGKQESMAGYLDLTQVQQISGDGSQNYPALIYTYFCRR